MPFINIEISVFPDQYSFEPKDRFLAHLSAWAAVNQKISVKKIEDNFVQFTTEHEHGDINISAKKLDPASPSNSNLIEVLYINSRIDAGEMNNQIKKFVKNNNPDAIKVIIDFDIIPRQTKLQSLAKRNPETTNLLLGANVYYYWKTRNIDIHTLIIDTIAHYHLISTNSESIAQVDLLPAISLANTNPAFLDRRGSSVIRRQSMFTPKPAHYTVTINDSSANKKIYRIGDTSDDSCSDTSDNGYSYSSDSEDFSSDSDNNSPTRSRR